MSLQSIITLPDPILRQVSQPIETVNDELLRLADDMLETMYKESGIGLAAIQVAIPRRILVVDVGEEQNGAPLVYINPQILWLSDTRSSCKEGCLSIPDVYAEVERPAKIRISYIDRAGLKQETEAEGLLATCLQHEIDHLDGKLFIDHLSKLRRDILIKRYKKLCINKKLNGNIL